MNAVTYSAGLTADTLVKRGFTKYWGYIVTTATATGAIDILDATAAATGSKVDSIPASTAVGQHMLQAPIALSTGLFIDFTGTGTIVVLFE